MNRNDKVNIVFLILLYVLQGIPIGLSETIPILLQRRRSTYSQQAIFAYSSLPYSIKLFWAPIVDSLYVQKIGRRRTWVIPLQIITGILLIAFAQPVEFALEAEEPQILFLTVYFFLLYFLMATQDIAVDGWALTLLPVELKSWQSSCNVVGQTLGIHIASSLFLMLNQTNALFSRISSDNQPLVSLSSFMQFCGVLFMVVTIYLIVFFPENHGYTAIPTTDDASSSPPLAESVKGSERSNGDLMSKRKKKERSKVSNCDSGRLAKPSAKENKPSNISEGPQGSSDVVDRGSDDSSSDSDDRVIHPTNHIRSRSSASRSAGDAPHSPQVMESIKNNGDTQESGEVIEEYLGVKDTYLLIFKIFKNRNFFPLALVLLTNRIGVVPVEAAGSLSLLDKGMDPVSLSYIGMVASILELFVASILSRFQRRFHSLRLFLYGYVARISFCFLIALFAHYLPTAAATEMESKYLPWTVVLTLGSKLTGRLMAVASMAYFAEISDPTHGGTYMALFNTISNLGYKIYVSPSLKLIDAASIKECVKGDQVVMDSCVGRKLYHQCSTLGGQCVDIRNGLTIVSIPSFILGIIWIIVFSSPLKQLESVNPLKWRVS